jgi:hypothetical protein
MGVLLSLAFIIYLIIREYGLRLPAPTRPAAQLGVAAVPRAGMTPM